MIVVFTGGTGGTKLVQGLQQVVAPEELTVIVNTGDDIEWWGLHVSPDVDSVLYGLGGLLSKDRGWGVDGDSFRCLERMKQLDQPGWFSLGDLDLATHLTRTALLRAGKTLSEATAELAGKFGIRVHVLPMSDNRVSTILDTAKGTLTFQEYFVRERHQVEVQAVRFEGAEGATPAPGVIEAIRQAEAIAFAPSNPVTSIGPILAVPGIREALRSTPALIVAVSPIVGGAAVSGPAGQLMQMNGWPSTIHGVAQAYDDFLDILVIDAADADAISTQPSASSREDSSNKAARFLATNTMMHTLGDKRNLAAFLLDACELRQNAGA
ncbi:MAG TPA: 2-phospho-L-lactate transferase [Verrucomicrobiae bacterium]|jgi:LPPG:FO 2-phospho-L-lactate transferase|nr:2-phospho-L-lactate transferase [Verrucomicrobiae bacterium]